MPKNWMFSEDLLRVQSSFSQLAAPENLTLSCLVNLILNVRRELFPSGLWFLADLVETIYGGQVHEKRRCAHELTSVAPRARPYGTPLKTAFIC